MIRKLMRVRHRVPLIACPVAAVLLAACGSGASTPGAGSPASSTPPGVAHARAAVAAYEKLQHFGSPGRPLTDAAKIRGGTVWYIPIVLTGVPTFHTELTVLQQAFGLLGVTVRSCDAGGNPTGVASCLNQATNAKADGIITDYIPEALAAHQFQAVVAARIPLLLTNSGESLPAGFAPDAALQPVNGILESTVVADSIIADSDGKANVLVVRNDDSPASTAPISSGALPEFRRYCPGCKVTVVNTSTAQLSNLVSNLSSALIADPDASYVYTEFDSLVPYALQALRQQQRNSVKLASAAGEPDSIARIQAGQTQFADVGVDPVSQSWDMADQLLRLMLGMPTSPAAHQPLVRLFEQANVKDLAASNAGWTSGSWYTTVSYPATFRKLWGMPQ